MSQQDDNQQQPEVQAPAENLYPNYGSTYFQPGEPEEQRQANSAEASKVLEALPMLEEIIARFDKRITFYQSVDSIPEDVDVKPLVHQQMVHINKGMVAGLQEERGWLVNLKKTYHR